MPIESQWGEIFHTSPYCPFGPPSLLYIGYLLSFPGVKPLERGVNHPLPSSPDVKQRIQIDHQPDATVF